MTWTVLTFNFGSTLTSTQMTQLSDNVTALANGDSGAPSIKLAALDSACVSQSKLKTATASGSTAVTSGNTGTYALSGSGHSWWTAGSDGAAGGGILEFGAGDTAAGTLGFRNYAVGVSTVTVYVDERYVQASPPYDPFGQGEIPLFVELLIENGTGKMLGVRVAPDPVWAYHGPTNILPQRIDTRTGKQYRVIRTVGGVPLAQALRQDAALRGKLLRGEVDAVEREVEITQAYKNQDRLLLPHYYHADDLTGKTVVLLDPYSQLVQKLFDMAQDTHARDVRTLIEGGYLQIDNTPKNGLLTCDGVMGVRAKWKLT